MTWFNNLLNNNFLTHDLVYFGVFTGTASLLGYLIFILRLSSIIIYFDKYFINLSNVFIKKVQEYFRVFRFLIMLIIFLKFIWIYEWLFYSLCISTLILLGYAVYRYRSAFTAIPTKMSLMVIIDLNFKKIIVYPDRNITEMTNMDIVERRFEFNISNLKIRQIRRAFGPNIFNNEITGQNANQIVATYVMPLIESSPMNSLFLEILNHI
uniref:Uncharacterized protein n=1 Tax=Russula abietina TaxID=482377 RepID=A0A2S0U3Q2_9AGAM|nr:hypothetical protein [Russula abietina]AWB36118.1 hypothetical protein [Russula abietina]